MVMYLTDDFHLVDEAVVKEDLAYFRAETGVGVYHPLAEEHGLEPAAESILFACSWAIRALRDQNMRDYPHE
jgi:hypothetical protein